MHTQKLESIYCLPSQFCFNIHIYICTQHAKVHMIYISTSNAAILSVLIFLRRRVHQMLSPASSDAC